MSAEELRCSLGRRLRGLRESRSQALVALGEPSSLVWMFKLESFFTPEPNATDTSKDEDLSWLAQRSMSDC